MTRSECRKRNARRLCWAFLLLLLPLSGCDRPTREVADEFSRITRAIDGLRNAQNAHKAQMIQPLRAALCTRFCQLRDQCVSAYEAQILALDLIERARSGPLVDPHALDEAQRTLVKARGLATECASEQAKLGRQFSR